MQAPLAVIFAWHGKDDEKARLLALQLAAYFCRDVEKPFSRNVSIPVYYQTANEGEQPVPCQPLRENWPCMYFLLTGDAWTELADEWEDYLGNVQELTNVRIVPIALVADAVKCAHLFHEVQFIRMDEYHDDANQAKYLGVRILHEIYRQIINTAPARRQRDKALTIFLSHTKQGGLGEELAKQLQKEIEELRLQTFFDAQDIVPGCRFRKEIESNLTNAMLLLIQTDAYSSRYWCQWELSMAKKSNLPIVALDALRNGEDRKNPFNVNFPCLCVRDKINEVSALQIMLACLLETIRTWYVRELLEKYRDEGIIPARARVLSRPPEMADLLKPLRKGTELIYPDPPVYEEEIEPFQAQGANCRTPLTLSGATFRGKCIGISVSDCREDTILQYCEDESLVERLAQEAARHLLARKATLLYGGDFRQGGLTELLFDEASRLRNRLEPEAEKEDYIRHYVAWPLYHFNKEKADEWKKRYYQIAGIRRIECPPELKNQAEVMKKSESGEPSEEERFILSECFTKMREDMIDDSDIRISAAGKCSGYQGLMPGVLEEIKLAIEKGKPLYLLGGFGGLTAKVCHYLLTKEIPQELTLDWQQRSNGKSYTELLDYARAQGKTVDYEAIIRNWSISSLNNGLSDADNERLLTTSFIDEAIMLLMKGIEAVSRRRN